MSRNRPSCSDLSLTPSLGVGDGDSSSSSPPASSGRAGPAAACAGGVGPASCPVLPYVGAAADAAAPLLFPPRTRLATLESDQDPLRRVMTLSRSSKAERPVLSLSFLVLWVLCLCWSWSWLCWHLVSCWVWFWVLFWRLSLSSPSSLFPCSVPCPWQ